MKKIKRERKPNRIYPEGFIMDRDEFMFRCFMTGAKKIHERLSDKRVLLNIHNNYDWRKKKTDGRGIIWFNVKMGPEYDTFWDDWENECKKLKMRYKIRAPQTFNDKNYVIRLEW
jgi:hypothetical protein